MSDENFQDPALKGFNPTAYQVKTVAAGSLKGGAVGAAGGAALCAALVALPAIALTIASGPIGWIAGAIGVTTGAAGALILPTMGAAALAGAGWGGAAGAAIGGFKEVSNASGNVRDEENRLMDNHNEQMLRQRRLATQASFAAGQQGGQGMGFNPNVALPRRGNGQQMTA